MATSAGNRLGRWIGVAASVAGTAALGSLASGQGANSRWYHRLDKPPFQPPALAFPVVWTALYADIAVTASLTLGDLKASERTAFARALAGNLALNAAWSWVFFRWHRLGTAVAVAAALTVSSADLVRRTHAVEPALGRALAPYPAWCGFATALSATIWRRNR